MLALVFPAAILVGRFADFISFEEQDLGDTFVRIDLGRHRSRVRKLERYIAFPLGFKRRDVYDDATARVGAFTQADCHHVAWDAEIFDRAREGETVRRNDDVVVFDVDEALRIELLRIDDGAINVCEQFELVGTTHVVAIA